MVTTINGRVTAPAVVATNSGPSDSNLGAVAEDQQLGHTTGKFKNTGNIEQTVTVAAVASGVQVDQVGFATTNTDSVTLQPGEYDVVNVVFTTPDLAPGDADVDFAITLDATWS